jgi:hypothetical protein
MKIWVDIRRTVHSYNIVPCETVYYCSESLAFESRAEESLN